MPTNLWIYMFAPRILDGAFLNYQKLFNAAEVEPTLSPYDQANPGLH